MNELQTVETHAGVGPGDVDGTVRVILIGPRPARRSALGLVRAVGVVQAGSWDDLPAGPAVCLDARRLVHLSPGGIDALAGALRAGAAVALPTTNSAPWPMCGQNPPRAAARVADLDAHAAEIAGAPTVDLATMLDTERDRSLPLPAVIGVADASAFRGAPTRLGDLLDAAAGGRIDVVGSVWCHDRNVPLVTLSMIVKNEAEQIETAIRLGRQLADEVVVYDTGSDDDTVELARASGARVQLGYWDDDFSRARNESMAMVRGDWVLVLDGDDELVGTSEDFVALRRALSSIDEHHAIELRVRNVESVLGQLSAGTLSSRLFQRSLRYGNRVHEVVFMPDGRHPQAVTVTGPWIRHTGYVGDQDERIDRNLRLVGQRVDDATDVGHRALAMLEYGRTLGHAGRVDEAIEAFAAAVSETPHQNVHDLATLLWASMVAERDGRPVVEPMLLPLIERGGAAGDAARWIMTTVLPAEESMVMLEGVEQVECQLVTASADEIKSTRALLCVGLGRLDEAMVHLAGVEQPVNSRYAWIAATMAVTSGSIEAASQLVEQVGADDLRFVVGALAEGPAAGGHVVAVGLWDRFPGHPALVAFLGTASPRGGFIAAMEARSLLTEADAMETDPLQRLIDQEFGDVADRTLAALVLDELVDGERRLPGVAASIPRDLHDAVIVAVEAVLPDMVPTVLGALAAV